MNRPVALVAGMVAGDPGQGGATWAVLQYGLGLRRLGYDALFVEPVRDGAMANEAVLDYFASVVGFASLERRCCLLDTRTGQVHGIAADELRSLAGQAELIINVSGMLPLEPPFERIPIRAYLDLDPAFNQLWHGVEGIDQHFDGHTHHFTVGLQLGGAGCRVPTCGVEWLATLPPVVLHEWTVPDTAASIEALTTVGNWRSYGSVEYEGTLLGQKAHSMRSLLELADRSPVRLRPALSIDPGEIADLTALRAHGWTVLDPSIVAQTPSLYRSFVAGSLGELGIAKSGYVTSRSGWFSDRSACYLASGRPVIAQDTGFSSYLPVGHGLLAFDGVEDAATRIGEVAEAYPDHCRAARDMAEDLLDSDKVLGNLLQRVGLR